MATTCTRCYGLGFLNTDQIPDGALGNYDTVRAIQEWMKQHPDSDVQVCDCCGDGEAWYGEPGEHYNSGDPPGPGGPYASNGGLCRCH